MSSQANQQHSVMQCFVNLRVPTAAVDIVCERECDGQQNPDRYARVEDHHLSLLHCHICELSGGQEASREQHWTGLDSGTIWQLQVAVSCKDPTNITQT